MPEATVTAARQVPVPDPAGASTGPGPATPSPADAAATDLVDALSVAWTMFRVYQDPRRQEAFRRAVGILDAAPRFPWTLEVRGDGFRHSGRPVATRRQSAPALARAAFAAGISALGFAAPPSPDDLLRLFEVLSLHAEAGAAAQGPAAALAAAGAVSVIVLEHGRLTEVPDGVESGAVLVPETTDSAAAARPVASGPADQRYLDEYRLLYERLQAADFQGLQELVHEFTDSFFALPPEQQSRILEEFLTHHQEKPYRLLLDQFSQDDLAELSQLLSAETSPLLVEYARIAAEQDGQAGTATEVAAAEQLIGDHISRLLHSGRARLRRQVGEALRSQVPGERENRRAAVRATAALLALGNPDSFARLARAVALKTATALGQGDLDGGAAWGQTLLAAASTPAGKEVARRELQAALRPDILDRLLPALAGHQSPPPAIVTLVALFALDPLLERLAAERDKGRRRALVELVTAAARLRPGPLVRRLADPRWFLVRNLVDALAHSGHPEAAAGIREVCRHADHRVRREARRALPLLDPIAGRDAAIEALADPEPALRLQALGLLRVAPGPEADAALAAFVASRPAVAEAAAAVEVLAARHTPRARTALRRLARPGLSLSASRREARRAARRALHGGRR